MGRSSSYLVASAGLPDFPEPAPAFPGFFSKAVWHQGTVGQPLPAPWGICLGRFPPSRLTSATAAPSAWRISTPSSTIGNPPAGHCGSQETSDSLCAAEEQALASGHKSLAPIFAPPGRQAVGLPNLAYPHPKAPAQRLSHCPSRRARHRITLTFRGRLSNCLPEKYRLKCGPTLVWPAICEKHPTGPARLVPLLWGVNTLAERAGGKTPPMPNRLPDDRWVFTWDGRRRVGYLLVLPANLFPRADSLRGCEQGIVHTPLKIPLRVVSAISRGLA